MRITTHHYQPSNIPDNKDTKQTLTITHREYPLQKVKPSSKISEQANSLVSNLTILLFPSSQHRQSLQFQKSIKSHRYSAQTKYFNTLPRIIHQPKKTRQICLYLTPTVNNFIQEYLPPGRTSVQT